MSKISPRIVKLVMTDELLDLVGGDDEIIGEVWKSKAHKNPGLIHREVAIIIYDNKNRVLFQKRAKNKKINPGIWAESVAGHVPKGMKPVDAAHMELKEELGFDTKLKFFKKTLAKMPKETHFTYWYIGKYPKGVKITLQKDEVEKAEFFSQEEFEKLIKSGEVYEPVKLAGQPEDVVELFWKEKRLK